MLNMPLDRQIILQQRHAIRRRLLKRLFSVTAKRLYVHAVFVKAIPFSSPAFGLLLAQKIISILPVCNASVNAARLSISMGSKSRC